MRTRQRRQGNGQGSLRIIGGEWRGRRLQFPEADGLRPTADRVRETLFNWLAPRIPGARCLDMFAGSGALGLEALSRGAAHCSFVEQLPIAAKAIEQHLKTLGAEQRAAVIQGDALTLKDQAFDLVFIDPPFSAQLTAPALEWVVTAGLLADDARIYLELGRAQPLPDLPPTLDIIRDKVAGDVRYLLLATAGLSEGEPIG